jgi:uncharacterized protein (DUF1786 family)
MKILAVDIGTGTQDILLLDSRLDVENSLKMVMPSPTMMARRKLQVATQLRQAVVLTGVTMGGGPSHWAAEDHLAAGLRLYATPDAARSFNDDLEMIREMGITVIGEDEAAGLPEDVVRLELRDLDLGAILVAFASFGVGLSDVDAVAAAVFDHGAAPPGVSDRKFRFDHIAERVAARPDLCSFAFLAEDVPAIMTRMQAVVDSAGEIGVPLVLMDSAPAAVQGALLDDRVQDQGRQVLANVGNFHTIAFLMEGQEIAGVFEHHTGMLETGKLDGLIERLAGGTLTNEEVFGDQGHGALVREGFGGGEFGLAVTGPRRGMMSGSRYETYFPAPYGDMMLAGCFGLARAAADLLPEYREQLLAALEKGREKPPWELG